MRGRKFKYDYTSDKFLKQIAEMARNGMTDKEISQFLKLSPKTFSDIKHEKDKSGKPTDRSEKIAGTLARARVEVNQLVRQVFLQAAFGLIKRKKVVCQRIEAIDKSNAVKITTVEETIPPNVSALQVWLYNHDDEWRENIRRNKHLKNDQTTKFLKGVNIKMTYTRNNKK